MEKRAFAILARRNDRIRNLNLSSSVCVMMRLKFADGSIVPVMSSTVSICRKTDLVSSCCEMI